MHVITARNVNDAYRQGMILIAEQGEHLLSRNGPVRRMVDPVTTKYERPTERVLFDAQRDANPFFHLFEALWMLKGGDDVKTLDHVLSSFKQFSDNGRTFHGAYGYRWRHWPKHTTTYTESMDQIAHAIQMLQYDLTSRRVVISMWDPARDLGVNSLDLPCNDLIKLAVVHGALDMQVYNRSNDIVFGAYGANAVHMSILQEYIAAMVGIPVGRYFQISADFHAYTERPYRWEKYWPLHDADNPDPLDMQWLNPYTGVSGSTLRGITVHPLVTDRETFDSELTEFIRALRDHQSVSHLDPQRFRNSFFRNVAIPMHFAFQLYLKQELRRACNALDNFRQFGGDDCDWLFAGLLWLERRALYRGEDVRR